jgi:hypothetical protein
MSKLYSCFFMLALRKVLGQWGRSFLSLHEPSLLPLLSMHCSQMLLHVSLEEECLITAWARYDVSAVAVVSGEVCVEVWARAEAPPPPVVATRGTLGAHVREHAAVLC